MKKELVVEKSNCYTRNAILENSELVELIVEENNTPQIDSIYLGKVQKILKDKFAFVNIGHNKNAFICLTDKKEEHLYINKNGKKTLKIKEGQNILVQIKKDGTDLKGLLVTSSLSISGKYTVLLLNENSVYISNKIKDLNIRSNLKENIQKILPKEYGLVIRTSAQNININSIQNEISELIKTSKKIFDKINSLKSPCKIYSASSMTEKIIQDYLTENDNVYINDENLYKKIKSTFKNSHLHTETIPIFHKFYIETQIEKAFHSKIWLKNGGFLIIDEVEAMNVIDVNSGKNIKKNYDEMIFKTNLQAAYETFKQIRLRNLSGIIFIDFINMKKSENIKELLNLCKTLANLDKTKISIISMTELGLLQLTRKKSRKSLKEVFRKNCPVCLGSGTVYNENYVSNIIKNEVLAISSSNKFKNIKISSNKRIIDSFKNNFDIENFNKNNDKKLELNIIQTSKFDYFEIDKI